MRKYLALAPLAGYTDKAFREIATGYGASFCVSEMVSAEALARGSRKTEALMEPFDGERNLVVQLFGPDSDPFERALPALRERNIKYIDINAGCPVSKVVKTGSGSNLMTDMSRAERIIKTLKDSLDGVHVSIKFRLGWDKDSMNYIEFAHMASESGAEMLTLHSRTRSQMYSGEADKTAFKRLRDEFPENSSSPLLFASGDVFSAEDAFYYLSSLGADGVMFARGAIGNPFIIRETKELIEKGNYRKASIEEKVSTAIRHLHLAEKYYGENYAVKEMRKHLMAYIKGEHNAARVKAELCRKETILEYVKLLETLV